jgi:hypothetical protein
LTKRVQPHCRLAIRAMRPRPAKAGSSVLGALKGIGGFADSDVLLDCRAVIGSLNYFQPDSVG